MAKAMIWVPARDAAVTCEYVYLAYSGADEGKAVNHNDQGGLG